MNSVCCCAGRLLNDKSLGEEACVRTLNVLACAALKDDVILLLHQDRREHILMNYAFDIDRLPLLQQKALALFVRMDFFCFNFFQTVMSACKMNSTQLKCKGTFSYWLVLFAPARKEVRVPSAMSTH